MILVSIQEVVQTFGVNEVLRGVTFTLQKGEHMGLIGVNGSGKSTLMRLMAQAGGAVDETDGGLRGPTSGQIHVGRETRVGYLRQMDDIALDDTVYGAMLRVFADVIALEERLRDMEREMAAPGLSEEAAVRLADAYHAATERFDAMSGYAYPGEIQGVLSGLSFGRDTYERAVGTLSGGERTRLSLAKMLLQKPDLLLLDEPTNHLDLDAIAWLENYLKESKATMLVISHDRYFLDAVCGTIGELLSGRMIKYQGNYTLYQKKRAQDFEARMKAFTLQQRDIARERAIIERYRSFNREKSIRAAESREKRLAKVALLEKPAEESAVRFSFSARRRTGEEVLKARRLTMSFDGRTLFRDLSFTLRAGDRVALIGPNGIGKSTLFHIVTGALAPDAGVVQFGVNVDMGYYDQHQAALSPDKTVLDEVWDAFPTLPQDKVRGALGLFLFSGDDVFQPIRSLSGGERGRVALTKLMLRHDNFLLMDEPTNHLDMDSREALEDALSDYDGTILAISHDRYFINRFATRVLVMGEDGMTEYLGDYDDYIEKRDRPVPPETLASDKTRTALAREKRREREIRQRLEQARARVKALEVEIEASETRLQEIERRMADPATYRDPADAARCAAEYQRERDAQDALYDSLADAEDAVSAAEADEP